MTQPSDVEIDARGLVCPTPILKAKKALSQMQGGQLLRVTTTDPGAERDFQVFARQTGNVLVQQVAENGVMSHWLLRRLPNSA